MSQAALATNRDRVFSGFMKDLKSTLIATACLGVIPVAAEPVVPDTAAQTFPLTRVRITGGPFAHATEANRLYLLALEPDRLLAPFLREAGLKPKAESYGNWENTGLDGHTGGHYLTALANMIASGEDTPDGELRQRLDYMLDEMERCQKANGDGYIGGVPGQPGAVARTWQGRAGSTPTDFGLNGTAGCRWYNIHKTYAGLRDAWQLSPGVDQARDDAGRHGRLVARR